MSGQVFKKNIEVINELNYNTKIPLTGNDEKYKILFDLSEAGIFICSFNGEILEANRAAYIIYGYKPGELEGKNIDRLFKGKISAGIEPFSTSEDNAVPSTIRISALKKEGEEFSTEATIKFFKENEVKKFILFVKSLSKSSPGSQPNISFKPEEYRKYQAAFLSRISHDLRTPLIGITGYAKILSEELADPELKTMSEIIFESGRRLNEMLGLFLDLSVIESEKIKYNTHLVNLSPVVIKTAEAFESYAKKKGLKFKIDIDSSYIPALVDEIYFVKILNNLVSNAVRFTSEGEVKVELRSKVIDNQTFSITNVIDTGTGIENDELEKIRKFQDKSSPSQPMEFPEGGIGLVVTQRLIRQMRGNLIINSKPGKGSVFTVIFPSVPVKENIKYRGEDDDNLKLAAQKDIPKVLIVEDDNVTIEIMKIFLKEICSTESTTSGEEAVAMAYQKKYDAILMDINLKGMSGLEAARRIKTNPDYEKTPIVAVTAYAMIGDKERLLSEGCTHYISKPFFKKNLIDTVKQVLKSSKEN